jgi:hypothetical protein
MTGPRHYPDDHRVAVWHRIHAEDHRRAAAREFHNAAQARKFGFPDESAEHQRRALVFLDRAESASLVQAADGYIAALDNDESGALIAADDFRKMVRRIGYKVLAERISLAIDACAARLAHRPRTP